eukprot:TRINITY_DN26326_c0_g1_i4.p1 TRINITY_DN26326_c0_g1~~TRINITY_DN26326_c0_g1_i4.p1  ORF type:complete len:130 (-),score=31.06 TRINITY_DN26326_c0_g1_i4:210-566(-)
MNFVIMSSLLVGSAFATAFSSSDSNSEGISFGGATLANTDTNLIVLGREAYGFAEADADAEAFIPMSSGQTLGVKAQRFRGHTSPHRNVKWPFNRTQTQKHTDQMRLPMQMLTSLVPM